MYCTVYTTFPNSEEATRIGKILIEEKLAACVNFFPINSIYRWEGKIVENEEIAMFIKTRDSLTSKVIERIKELHSYKIPVIVTYEIKEGNDKFFEWIDTETEG